MTEVFIIHRPFWDLCRTSTCSLFACYPWGSEFSNVANNVKYNNRSLVECHGINWNCYLNTKLPMGKFEYKITYGNIWTRNDLWANLNTKWPMDKSEHKMTNGQIWTQNDLWANLNTKWPMDKSEHKMTNGQIWIQNDLWTNLNTKWPIGKFKHKMTYGQIWIQNDLWTNLTRNDL